MAVVAVHAFLFAVNQLPPVFIMMEAGAATIQSIVAITGIMGADASHGLDAMHKKDPPTLPTRVRAWT
jgi:hypothetical protein